MGKYMAELGLTPASRSRLAIQIRTGPRPWEFGRPARAIIAATEPSPTGEVIAAGTGELVEPGSGDIVIPADADRL